MDVLFPLKVPGKHLTGLVSALFTNLCMLCRLFKGIDTDSNMADSNAADGNATDSTTDSNILSWQNTETMQKPHSLHQTGA